LAVRHGNAGKANNKNGGKEEGRTREEGKGKDGETTLGNSPSCYAKLEKAETQKKKLLYRRKKKAKLSGAEQRSQTGALGREEGGAKARRAPTRRWDESLLNLSQGIGTGTKTKDDQKHLFKNK